MTLDPLAPLNQPGLSPANQASLRALVRAISGSQGSFSLILVRGNYRPLRDRITTALAQQLPVPLRQVFLSPPNHHPLQRHSPRNWR